MSFNIEIDIGFVKEIQDKLQLIPHYINCSDNLVDVVNILYAKEFGISDFKKLIHLNVRIGGDGAKSAGVLSEIVEPMFSSGIWFLAQKIAQEHGYDIDNVGFTSKRKDY